MIFYFAMTNSWSLLYDEIYGEDTMTEDIRITSLESDEYDPIVGSGNTAATFTTATAPPSTASTTTTSTMATTTTATATMPSTTHFCE